MGGLLSAPLHSNARRKYGDIPWATFTERGFGLVSDPAGVVVGNHNVPV